MNSSRDSDPDRRRARLRREIAALRRELDSIGLPFEREARTRRAIIQAQIRRLLFEHQQEALPIEMPRRRRNPIATYKEADGYHLDAARKC